MFPDLLLNANYFGHEVRLAPSNVTSYIQIESVDISYCWNRNHSAKKEEGRSQKIRQWPQYFERNGAEKFIH